MSNEDIKKCNECKMCDTIISLHERIKKLEQQIETIEKELRK